ncbi:hypothetical protein AGMMS50222_06470 [Endomicrobiia bacterium]|nr:hypothetical protein AGMMS49531_07390 [Endomicrobiia bacterium]GHT66037.1 hypothetical protein AGMMS49556_06590 [Endomicrobiia bacterium]GHT70360.1 hypothetical protein AGMMS49950_05200 [Endomicrobiia bacterium]GHT75466.1 hypothetical protein AGMMS50222_06470 [Endomicrobiia bacterium]
MNFWKKCSIYTLIILTASLFFGCKSEKTVVEETPSVSEQTIKKVFMIQTEKGKIKFTVESESVIINESENIADLERPVVKFYDDKGKLALSFVMKKAKVNILTYDINGIGECTIDSVNNGNLKTSDLFYNAKEKLLYGDHDVTIIRSGETVYGKSFKYDVKLDKMIIKDQRTAIEKI